MVDRLWVTARITSEFHSISILKSLQFTGSLWCSGKDGGPTTTPSQMAWNPVELGWADQHNSCMSLTMTLWMTGSMLSLEGKCLKFLKSVEIDDWWAYLNLENLAHRMDFLLSPFSKLKTKEKILIKKLKINFVVTRLSNLPMKKR